MNKFSKIFVIFLCLAVLISSSSSFFHQEACAIAGVDDLLVAGVAVMSMAVVGSLGIIAINSAGFSDALLAAADNAGTEVKIFAQQLFESYARTQNITAGQAVQIAQQGTSYLEDGSIIFNQSMSNLMSGFLDWAWSADGGNLISSSPSAPPSDPTLDYSDVDTSVLFYPNFSYVIKPFYCDSTFSITDITNNKVDTFTFSAPAYYIKVGTNNSFYAFSKTSFTVSRDLYSHTWTAQQITYHGLTYYYTSFNQNPSYSNASPVYPISSVATIGRPDGQWDIAYLIFNGVVEGDTNYDVNLDILDGITDAGEVNLLDPDTMITPTDAPVAGGTIAIDDWIAYLADAIAEGVASVPVDIDGVVTDVSLELDNTSDIPVSVTDSITGSRPVADSSSIDDLTPYTLDLIDFFPFCIPFDIYDMLSMFAAERQAPYIEWRFYIPNICDETIVLDFSVFDPVAQVLRTVELVAFAIGLAFVTKKLIQGGD